MHEPWVVYLVVLGAVGAMVYGKFLIFGGDDKDDRK